MYLTKFIRLIVVFSLCFCGNAFACYDINVEIIKSKTIDGKKRILLPNGDIYLCDYPSIIDGLGYVDGENLSIDIVGGENSNFFAAVRSKVYFENAGPKKLNFNRESVYGVVKNGFFMDQDGISFKKYHYIDGKPVIKKNSSVDVDDDVVKTLSMERMEDLYLIIDHGWESSRHKITSIDGNSINYKPNSRHYIGDKVGIQNFYIHGVSSKNPTMGRWRKCPLSDGCIEILPSKSDVGMTGEILLPVNKNILIVKNIGKNRSRIGAINFYGVGFVGGGCNQVSDGYSGEQSGFRIGSSLVILDSSNISIFGGRFFSGLCSAVRIDNYSDKITIQDSVIENMGGGGIYVGGQYSGRIEPAKKNSLVVIKNNRISNIGMIFEGASGIWLGDVGSSVIDGNEIYNSGYSGISIGGRWGYGENNAVNNKITNNRIESIGRKRLSDMGGIYTVGEAKGLVISGNSVRGVNDYGKYASGAWCLYLDEGSTGINVFDNNFSNCSSGGVGIHYGKDINIINNLFSGGIYRKIFAARIDISGGIYFNGVNITNHENKTFELVNDSPAAVER